MAAGKTKRLHKELKLFDVFAIAAGTTLSGGFFLLPGLAAKEAGPALVLAYLLSAIPLIPAMLSLVELSTAMPRAGGIYYVLDRSLGPLVGTVGGIGTWLALILKVAFSLVGMGAYVRLFFPQVPILPFAVGIALALGVLNLFGAGKSGKLQIYLVCGLLGILAFFIAKGIPRIQPAHFEGFLDAGWSSILSTAGLVYISYVGITKVAGLAEEVKDPERNLPLGIFLALGTSLVIYVLGTLVMVGVVPMDRLMGDLTPVATATREFAGGIGVVFVSLAAVFAFISVANAGTLSASRYPMAMSRDHMLPAVLGRLGRRGTPIWSIAATVGGIVVILLLLQPMKIAKLASAFQLLMLAAICLAVIVMRESRIESYDPGYRSPFYPWMHLLGAGASVWLIGEMGWLPIVFTLGLVGLGGAWYWFYVRGNVARNGAIYHIFERLGQQRYEGLDRELREILKEKGLRQADPFDEVVARAHVLDLDEPLDFEEVVRRVAWWQSSFVPHSAEEISRRYLEGTLIGETPVTHGVALPHLRIEGLQHPEMALVRSRPGVRIAFNDPLMNFEEDELLVHAIFFLMSPDHDPAQHLRILAQIAGRVDEEGFAEDWMAARDEQELKEVLLRDERSLSLRIRAGEPSGGLIGKGPDDPGIPEGCVVALLRRGGRIQVPTAETVFRSGDRITVIGHPRSMREFARRFVGVPEADREDG